MFYSHEILTSREHGVATVWLVATLGSKSTTRKVNRKAILDVNVPKACGIIVHPEVPMALRLQGNLLYGISKVYSQQCAYTLMDVQSTRDRMMTMLKVIKGAGLDPEAGKARPDQIVLPHDPSFIPDLMLPGLNVDLSTLALESRIASPQKSSLLSSFLPRSQGFERLGQQQTLQLDISSSDTGMGNVGAQHLGSQLSSARKEAQIELPAYTGDEAGVLLQPDFEFDGEGNIVELEPDLAPTDNRAGQAAEEEKVRRASRFEAFADEQPIEGDFPLHDSEVRLGEEDIDVRVDLNQSPTQEQAPEVKMGYKQRQPRAILADNPAELRNSDLAQWNSEYALNMAVASRFKQANKLATIAKKNAAFWVLGSGIGAVGTGIGASATPHPLAAFSGGRLLEALTGIKTAAPAKRGRRKRSHDETSGDDDDADPRRRVRARSGDHEIGDGDFFADVDGVGVPMDVDVDVEVGRRGPASLQDDPSLNLPWNITASVKSSAQASSVYSRHLVTNAGRSRSIMTPGPEGMVHLSSGGLPFGPRRGRLTSASPLAGRGVMHPSGGSVMDQDMDVDLDTFSGIGGDYQMTDNDAYQDANDNEQDTTALDKPKWLTNSLDQESVNFYDYVKDRIHETAANAKASPNSPCKTIGGKTAVSFASLLPVESNTRIVATQALMHVLILATNGGLRVSQGTTLRIPKGARDTGDIFMALA